MPERRRGKRTKSKTHYHGIPLATVQAYADDLLSLIRSRLSGKIYFTRDTLLHLDAPQFEDVATVTQYSKNSIAISYLIEQGKIANPANNHLCLPENVPKYQKDFIEEHRGVRGAFEMTVYKLVTRMPPQKPFAIMQVVERWRTDPHLTQDAKRLAVRSTMPKLVREKVCARVGRSRLYVVEGAS